MFKKNKGAVLGGSSKFEAECSTTGEAVDCGWNGLGNGTLQHMRMDDAPDKIQIYDHANNIFVTRDGATDMKLAVGTSFFMQVDAAKNIDFIPAQSGDIFLAPERNGQITDEFRLALTAEGQDFASDRLWVSASEDANGEYMVGRDLLKMGTPTNAKVAQIWTTNNKYRLCDIEMPLIDDVARCDISLFAPQANQYTLGIEKAPENATLYLTFNGKPIWNLSMSPYTFDLEKGTTNGYGLQMYVHRTPQVATGVDELQNSNAQCQKVLIDQVMYIITPDGAIFSATGKKIQ